MSSLLQLFFLLLHLLSTYTYALNSTYMLDREGFSSGEPTLPIDVIWNFTSIIAPWSDKGQGFGSGAIDLGGLEVRQIKSFNRIWRTDKGGPNDSGATFFEPSPIPDEFHMLGSYAQSNDKALFGLVLVGKDLANGTLSEPKDYTLVWSGNTTEGNGYFWLPIPPDGYKSVGYIVTKSPLKPPLDKIRCVRSNFTENCENGDWIWGDDGINIFKLRPSDRGVEARGFSAGTFSVQDGHAGNVISCLSNLRNDFPIMPDKSQLMALIKDLSPFVYFHPKEEFFPCSLAWFWNNRAFLYKERDESNPIRIDPLGSNLPINQSGDGMYWMDLPKNESDRNIVKRGDISNTTTYYHIKPMYGATYTDIAVWIFFPFNGNAKLKIEPFETSKGVVGPFEYSLGKIEEHIGDWEHLTIRINNFDGELNSVYFPQHNNGIWLSATELEYKEGLNRFMTFSCLHSHVLEPHPITQVYKAIIGKSGLLKEAQQGNYFLDTALQYSIISAEYLGLQSGFVEPKWLSYSYEWGPDIDYSTAIELENFIKNSPEIFRPLLSKLLDNLPAYFFDDVGSPVGPKWEKSWDGDESYRFDSTNHLIKSMD